VKKIVILSYPLAFDAPVRGGGGSRRNIATPFGTEKLEWCGYPIVKKFRRYFYSFWHDPRTWQTDIRTDGQTDTVWRQRPRLCIASRGKNYYRCIRQREARLFDSLTTDYHALLNVKIEVNQEKINLNTVNSSLTIMLSPNLTSVSSKTRLKP